MRTIPNIVSIVSVLTLVSRVTGADVAQQEIPLVNPASGTKLWASVSYPSNATAAKKYPAFVFVPGGLGFGWQMARGPQATEIARAGFVIGYFDPDGREQSRGSENWNGKVHQDGLRAFIKRVARLAFVDPSNIGVVSSSLG